MAAIGKEVLMRRGARTLTRCLAAISLVISVAACGGGSGDADREATTIAPTATNAELPAPNETVIDAEVSATVRAIVDRLGPDAAFSAVVLALDAGYGADQIAQHAGALTSDGTIPGTAPLGRPSGVFATATAQGLRRAAEHTPAQALANLKAKAYDEDTVETLLGTVLLLAGTGYSAEQILEGLLFGEQRYARTALDPGPEGGGARYERCILLAEQDGTLIVPAGPSTVYGKAELCALGIKNRAEVLVVIDGEWVEASTTTDSAVTQPPSDDTGVSPDPAAIPDGVYTGTVSYPEDKYFRRIDGTIEISIVDGAAEVTVAYTAWENLEYSIVDDDAPKCAATAHSTLSGTGTAGPPLSAALTQVSVDIIDVEGICETPAEERLRFPGIIIDISLGYADNVFSGTIFEVIDVTARPT